MRGSLEAPDQLITKAVSKQCAIHIIKIHYPQTPKQPHNVQITSRVKAQTKAAVNSISTAHSLHKKSLLFKSVLCRHQMMLNSLCEELTPSEVLTRHVVPSLQVAGSVTWARMVRE